MDIRSDGRKQCRNVDLLREYMVMLPSISDSEDIVDYCDLITTIFTALVEGGHADAMRGYLEDLVPALEDLCLNKDIKVALAAKRLRLLLLDQE